VSSISQYSERGQYLKKGDGIGGGKTFIEHQKKEKQEPKGKYEQII